MVARRTVVFRLYCATQLYTTVSSAIGMTKYCDSTDVSEDESTDYPESEHSDFTELQSSGISEDGSTDHPFSEYSETECSDFEDDVSIISHTDVDSDCLDDEKSCSATPLLEFDELEEQKEHKDYLHAFPSSSACLSLNLSHNKSRNVLIFWFQAVMLQPFLKNCLHRSTQTLHVFTLSCISFSNLSMDF